MGTSFPAITSRRFPLCWGIIGFYCFMIFTILSWVTPSILFLYPFCSNAVPLILLKPDLKWHQKIIWVSSQSIPQVMSMIVALLISISIKLDEKSRPPTKFLIEESYDIGYLILAIVIGIWMIVSLVQISSISFKHPKRWLICNVLTGGIAYLLLFWCVVSGPEKSSLGIVMLIFLYAIFIPGLTGLGLHFSGMGLRKQRDDRDRSLQ